MARKNYAYLDQLLSGAPKSSVEVKIGDIIIGGNKKVSVQSMLTSNTMDTEACVWQCIGLIEAGCEIVRITAPSIREAKNLVNIKSSLYEKGYKIPLVADIHYTPNAAMVAAGIVEKIRINPGNFVKGKKLSKKDELSLIKRELKPIIEICKQHKTAIRIGVNHGSLSERIMQDFGDSAVGMVESALEYLEICEDLAFENIIVSLKASSVKTMVKANRLMHLRMLESNKVYPIHLGVTEAGNGNDGRIKSAVGIASLLMEGIGNTIRVSLTEEPKAEIPVAIAIRERYGTNSESSPPIESRTLHFSKRTTFKVNNIGSECNPVVIADFSQFENIIPEDLSSIGYHYSSQQQLWKKSEQASDYVYIGTEDPSCDFPDELGIISDYTQNFNFRKNHFPLYTLENYKKDRLSSSLNFLKISCKKSDIQEVANIALDKNSVLVLESSFPAYIYEERKALEQLEQNGIGNPIVFKRNYPKLKEEEFLIYASADFGSLLIDGMGNGVWPTAENMDQKTLNSIAFGILQATGDRISKAEYISCPSCGRAKFDVQDTKNKIEAATKHLKGVKIGIMGCIVNGPGEMADADYGYVGSGNGKITLYKNRNIIRKDIPEAIATDMLIDLLKENGDWLEKEQEQN